MTTRRTLGLIAVALLATMPGCRASGPQQVQAEPSATWDNLPMVESASGSTELTLYASGWGLVTDTRLLSLNEGMSLVRFPHLALSTEEEGSYLQVPGTILRRRFRFDVQNLTRLMERYEGMTVEIVSPGGTAVEATVVMTETGPMYRIKDRLYADPPGKVALPIPEGMATTPSLEWVVRAPRAWTGLATASFIAKQLSWHSSYTLVTDAEQSLGNLQHWASLSNHSGGSFRDARITLVAGDVRRATSRASMMDMGGMRAYAPEAAVAESYAARYQYRLGERMTLERGAEERLVLAEAPGVAIARLFQIGGHVGIYRMPNPELPQKARLRLEIQNTPAANLGQPLPAGTVTVYTPNKQGILAIAGQTTVPDTPLAQKLILDLGEAFDVTAQRTQTIYQVRPDGHEVGYEILLKNAQDQPVTVDALESLSGDWTISNPSHAYDRLSANLIRFRIPVPAKGEVKLSYEAFIKKEN